MYIIHVPMFIIFLEIVKREVIGNVEINLKSTRRSIWLRIGNLLNVRAVDLSFSCYQIFSYKTSARLYCDIYCIGTYLIRIVYIYNCIAEYGELCLAPDLSCRLIFDSRPLFRFLWIVLL